MEGYDSQEEHLDMMSEERKQDSSESETVESESELAEYNDYSC